MNRRTFLIALSALTLGSAAIPAAAQKKNIRVVVWDEQQPAQKQVYSNYLGNEIVAYLRQQPGLEVLSVAMDDPQQGLSKDILDNTDVLIWWGHVRHNQVRPELVKDIADRVEAGKLNYLALHSAHFARPFIELMNRRAISDAIATLPANKRKRARVETILPVYNTVPKTSKPTPHHTVETGPSGESVIKLTLPNCCFTGVAAEGKPSRITVVDRKHPIAQGLPSTFTIPATEIYDGPFFVPKPDHNIFHEKWDNGGEFPAGVAWNIGKGKVFYYRPGHETYPIFKQAENLKVVENAVRWLGGGTAIAGGPRRRR